MKLDSIVILNLQSPKERIFGRLLDISTSGVTIRGIDLVAFDDWTNHLVHDNNTGLHPATSFFPLNRVERIILDESLGEIPSLSETFLLKVGAAVETYLE